MAESFRRCSVTRKLLSSHIFELVPISAGECAFAKPGDFHPHLELGKIFDDLAYIISQPAIYRGTNIFIWDYECGIIGFKKKDDGSLIVVTNVVCRHIDSDCWRFGLQNPGISLIKAAELATTTYIVKPMLDSGRAGMDGGRILVVNYTEKKREGSSL